MVAHNGIVQGVPVEFSDIDDTNRQWVVDFRSRALSPPNSLEKIDSMSNIIY